MSWVIVEKATGKAVMETWSAAIVSAISDKYEAMSARDYLERLNRTLKERSEA